MRATSAWPPGSPGRICEFLNRKSKEAAPLTGEKNCARTPLEGALRTTAHAHRPKPSYGEPACRPWGRSPGQRLPFPPPFAAHSARSSEALNYVSQNPRRPWPSGSVAGSGDWIWLGHRGRLGHYGGDRHLGGESSGPVGPGSWGEGEADRSGVLRDCGNSGPGPAGSGGLGGELCVAPRPGSVAEGC